jgi:hypothetical protein
MGNLGMKGWYRDGRAWSPSSRSTA